MRHYIAVQDSNGRWFYANEGRHRETGQYGWTPSGACTQKPTKQCPKCEGRRFTENQACDCFYGLVDDPDAVPCPGHATEAEAYEHQKQHMLAKSLHFWPDVEKPKQLYLCEAEDCETYTSGEAQVGSWFRRHLCAAHRTRETVEPMFHVGESWES